MLVLLTIQACLIILHFTLLLFFTKKFEVCGNPEYGKTIGIIFPTASAYFVFLYYFFVILAIFQKFHYFIMFVLVICVLYDCKKIMTHEELSCG